MAQYICTTVVIRHGTPQQHDLLCYRLYVLVELARMEWRRATLGGFEMRR
jgi:hypothetical protein